MRWDKCLSCTHNKGMSVLLGGLPCGLTVCANCNETTTASTTDIKPPELSTAEKLLWLVENYDIYIRKYADERGVVVLVEDRSHSKFIPTCLNGISFEKAISAAYDWAKEQSK